MSKILIYLLIMSAMYSDVYSNFILNEYSLFNIDQAVNQHNIQLYDINGKGIKKFKDELIPYNYSLFSATNILLFKKDFLDRKSCFISDNDLNTILYKVCFIFCILYLVYILYANKVIVFFLSDISPPYLSKV